MDKYTYIKNSIEQLAEQKEYSAKKARRYDIAWKTCQGLIALIGIITPLIVIYRKDSIFPQQFWVAWCIATPLLTSILSFLLTYFDWQGLSHDYSKSSALLSNLVERAENKLAFTEESRMQEFQDWLYEEKQRIEVVV